jgi:hypothetical protein
MSQRDDITKEAVRRMKARHGDVHDAADEWALIAAELADMLAEERRGGQPPSLAAASRARDGA